MFNIMQLILVNIKWHIKWKYLIQKFRDICLLYYLKKCFNSVGVVFIFLILSSYFPKFANGICLKEIKW